jgi:hypothetical protein
VSKDYYSGIKEMLNGTASRKEERRKEDQRDPGIDCGAVFLFWKR